MKKKQGSRRAPRQNGDVLVKIHYMNHGGAPCGDRSQHRRCTPIWEKVTCDGCLKAKQTWKKQGPRRAYVAVTVDDGTNRLGIATEGEAGYHRIREDADAGGPISTREEALVIADAYNEGLGLTKAEAEEIVFSSLFPRSRRAR